ncbi:winged helix DNA-binding protein [Fontibacillus phaseoli]|uniref:Winged helix DNA-binding protein n=1 Tax=Fontibacillus phaseoli TaxID=1416533 RepID=A0A369BMF1_9BACL|nr:winged helix DNA-binding domain-containing protein [Fontibacillus phaseoli]RCX21776.1 winged helix DNA-binding protein [Fontibacillus phaseoli]
MSDLPSNLPSPARDFDSCGVPGAILDIRTLNRSLLARQMLLQRERITPLDAIERLVGMQAQAPNAPYFGLWARLESFRQDELSRLLRDKQAVRLALMRSTLHLVSARDALRLRPWVQPVLDRGLKGSFGRQLAGLDADAVAAAGRTLMKRQPMTFSELGGELAELWPERDPDALAALVRTRLPLVQLPPRGLWGESGQARHTTAGVWLGGHQAEAGTTTEDEEDSFLLRYLAAFGPASIKDMQTWSGLTRLIRSVQRLRPCLAVFRDENGTELFDLPDAPRPGPETPAPARFLGEYDNILLSHADRRRIISEANYRHVFTKNGIIRPTILLDGFAAGIWKLEAKRSTATLVVDPLRKLAEDESEALHREGTLLVDFAAPECNSIDIRINPALDR